MIGPVIGARAMIATRTADFRKGPDALAALVGAECGGDPFSGVIYVSRAKRSDRIRLILVGRHWSVPDGEEARAGWLSLAWDTGRREACDGGPTQHFARRFGQAPRKWGAPAVGAADCRLTGLSPNDSLPPCSPKRTYPRTLPSYALILEQFWLLAKVRVAKGPGR